MSDTGIGARVKRKEDLRFLTGAGRFTDDLDRPGQGHACMLRSPHAHARIKGIDTSTAAAAPGVIAVYTGADVETDGVGGLPCGWGITSKDGGAMVEPKWPIIARDTVRFVGEVVAVAIAESESQARDAAEVIAGGSEVLPAPAPTDPPAPPDSGDGGSPPPVISSDHRDPHDR